MNHFQSRNWSLGHACPPFLELLNGLRLCWPYESAQHTVFNGETGRDITGQKSVIRNVFRLLAVTFWIVKRAREIAEK